MRVNCLQPYVTNELLFEAMEQFGTVEYAVVARDESTCRSQGYGIVEFAKEQDVDKAVNATTHQPYLLGSSPIPVEVVRMPIPNTTVGMPHLPGYNTDATFLEHHGVSPHFARERTLEYRFAHLWRQLRARHTSDEEQLKRVHEDEVQKLQAMQEQAFEQERLRLQREKSAKEMSARQTYVMGLKVRV